jgi:membrane associated rhomboid family serine protease
MIPYRDDNPTRSFAFVTYAIVFVNVALYVWSLLQPNYVATVCYWGAVAADLTGVPPSGQTSCPPGGAPAWMTVFSHMFFHGGILHLAGNMVYLLIFGNNIEDVVGHAKFLLFYALCGLAALAAQVVSHPAASVPMVGASGAIAGVLGAYLLLFPLARVHVLVPIVIFLTTIRVPAFVMLLLWFLIQVVNGMASSPLGKEGGVAWFAHVGGFVAGVFLILIFPKRRRGRRR